jgi:hypothetical protein
MFSVNKLFRSMVIFISFFENSVMGIPLWLESKIGSEIDSEHLQNEFVTWVRDLSRKPFENWCQDAPGRKQIIKLHRLSFFSQPLHFSEIKVLSEVLPKFSGLKELVLSYSHIGKQSLPILAKAIQTLKNLQILHLSGSQIDDAGAKILGNSISCLPELRVVHLSENRIGQDGAKFLFKSLQNTSTLQILNFYGNLIGDQQAYAIQNTVETH